MDVGQVRPRDAAELHVGAAAPALRTVQQWKADGRPVMVAIDVVPLTAATGRPDHRRQTDRAIGLLRWSAASPATTSSGS